MSEEILFTGNALNHDEAGEQEKCCSVVDTAPYSKSQRDKVL